MTRREALGVLMMSPIYYRLPLAARKVLLDEFCSIYGLPILSPAASGFGLLSECLVEKDTGGN